MKKEQAFLQKMLNPYISRAAGYRIKYQCFTVKNTWKKHLKNPCNHWFFKYNKNPKQETQRKEAGGYAE